MPPLRSRPDKLSPLGELIWDAMDRKMEPRGSYTYTELQRDIKLSTGHHHSIGHLRNILHGTRQPSRETIADLAAALGLDLDELLLLGGYVPDRLREALGAAVQVRFAADHADHEEPPAGLLDEWDELEDTLEEARASLRELRNRLRSPSGPQTSPS